MSKFAYVKYRSAALAENRQHKVKLAGLFNSNKDAFEVHEKDTTKLFIWNKAPNVFVSTDLDLAISLPSSAAPENALIRITNKAAAIEASGDAVGSRVLWYYTDDEKAVLSSSQRAIIAVLGSYEPAETAWSWMLSNGSLGPGFSWDKRLQALPAGALFYFDLTKWKATIQLKPWTFNYDGIAESSGKKRLSELLEEIKSDFDAKGTKTLLTLSGGYDSRAALYLLKHSNADIHTATWGIPSAFNTPLTDATVAKEVSNVWKVQHDEYNVQLSGDFDASLHRFLLHGEGRNDHINSFMDGLCMWEDIAAKGYSWVVRADEAFGWLPVRTELDARTSVALARFSDFNNLPPELIASLPEQVFPQYLERMEEEPVEDYRDRIYQQYRLPFVIGPLQDPPLSFVEIINPLLHPRLIRFVRTLPPQLRTRKKLYADWVDTLLPGVPYANKPAIPEAFHIAEAAENKALFNSFLYDPGATQLLGKELMTHLQKNWRPKEDAATVVRHGVLKKLKKFAPVGLKKFIRNKVTGYQINTSSLALRAYIIYKMQQIMKDAAS